MLQPYLGSHKWYKPFNRIIDDTIIYQWNSLGFRSEEYNPHAKTKIFVSGCSHTEGWGVEFQDTWPQQFKKYLAENSNRKVEEINVMNFAGGGHSNDYVTRTLLAQAHLVKPDFVIVYFTFNNRAEYYNEKGPHNVRAVALDGNTSHIKKKFSLDYLIYYTNEIGFVNTLKNMLLLQFFLKQHHINYIFAYMEIDLFKNKKYTLNPGCATFIKLLDKKYLCSFNLKTIDMAKDNSHPGPKSHKLFALMLLKFYLERFAKR